MTEINETLTDINDDIAAGILTDRQARFVFEYMKDQNASAAARRCGYAARSAANQGNRLLSEPAVRDRVRMEMRDMLAVLKLSVMDLIRERMRAAFFRNGPMFAEDGRLLQVQEMDSAMRESLDISVEMRGNLPVLKLKQPSREKALAALEKVHDKLDRLDEKYYDQLARREAAQGVPADDACSPPTPVRAEPGRSARERPLGTRPSTSSGRTGVGHEGPRKHHRSSSPELAVPEKPHHSSSPGMAASEKPPHLSSPAGIGVRERLAGVFDKLRHKPPATHQPA